MIFTEEFNYSSKQKSKAKRKLKRKARLLYLGLDNISKKMNRHNEKQFLRLVNELKKVEYFVHKINTNDQFNTNDILDLNNMFFLSKIIKKLQDWLQYK